MQKVEVEIMTWYAANLIMYIKLKNGKQDNYPIHENIILIKAKDEKEAYMKARERGKQEEGDSSGTLYYGDEPASMVFAGVRKITTCEEAEKRPDNGTEITYSEFEVDSEEKIRSLVNGDPVFVLYED